LVAPVNKLPANAVAGVKVDYSTKLDLEHEELSDEAIAALERLDKQDAFRAKWNLPADFESRPAHERKRLHDAARQRASREARRSCDTTRSNCDSDKNPTTQRRVCDSDKRPTKKRRQSAIADGTFVQALRAFGYFGTRKRGRASVGFSPLTLPYSATPLTPKQWRDSGDDVRGLFFHKALEIAARELGLTRRGFTLRLSNDVEARARAQERGCIASLHGRVALSLKRALNGSQGVLWWFAIEEDRNGALHLHGEIAFPPDALKLVRKALRGAGGKWVVQRRDGIRQRSPWQLRFETDPDFGWAGYCLKNVRKADQGWRRFMRRYGSPRRWTVGFEGRAVTYSAALVAVARRQHSMAVIKAADQLTAPSKEWLSTRHSPALTPP
jgi:hypothetical protein